MKKPKPQVTDKVSEPQAFYRQNVREEQAKEIIISSPEAQEEANYLYWLSLTPLQRLELHFKMASAFWHEALLKKKKYKKIIIT